MDQTSLSRALTVGGGLLGILAVIALIPAYVVRSPEQPTTVDEAENYFEFAGTFIALNGILPILHIAAFLLFLSVWATVLGSGGIAASAPRTAVLAGGAAHAALIGAGLVAEIAYAATLQDYPQSQLDPAFATVTLTLALWLYHFGQGAFAVLLIGSAIGILRTDVLPRWFGYLSIAFAVVALLHTWLGVWSAYAGLVWIVLASVMLLMRTRVGAAAPLMPEAT